MSDPQNTPRTTATPVPMAARPESANARLAELFPDLADGPTRRRWWQHRARVTVAGVTALALVAVGVVATQAGASDAPSYRTAAASVRDVDSVLTGVATIEPVSQATIAFPVAGTVSSVDVAIGDTVAVGQTLASLDSQSLTDVLHEKEAALDRAELILSTALAGEDVSGLTAGSGSGSLTTMQPASTSSSASATVSDATYSTSDPAAITLAATAAPQQAGSSDLAAAQQAVLDAQRAVDEAMTAATTALTVATDVCAAVGTDASDAIDAEATTTTTATDDSLSSCRTAIDAVLTAQTAVSEAQAALATAADELDTLLVQLTDQAATAAQSGQSGASSGVSGLPSGGTSPSTGSGATGGTATSSPSSKELIAYQKSVDAAELAVVVAQQAVAQATIVSPIAGVVVGQNLDVGDEVAAGSSTANIVVEGEGGFEATTTVPVDRVGDVQVGQAATVVPDGGSDPVEGEVVSVSVAPTEDTTTSYRVTIALTGDTSTLANGSTGSISIVTARATSALVVPTSAVTVDGDRHTVTVVDGSTSDEVSVQVGVIGDTWTEITRGVTEGDEVVLADLDEPLPGSATDTSADSTSATGATGGLPSGFPAGGFTGAPPGMGGN